MTSSLPSRTDAPFSSQIRSAGQEVIQGTREAAEA